MKLIDLSHTLTLGTPVWPGDTPLTLTPGGIAELGILDHRISMGMHVGTHIDGPRHMLPTGKWLHEFSVEKFHGRGMLVDCRGKKQIDASCLQGIELHKDDIVFLYSGWSDHYGTPQYFENYPIITPDCAALFVEAQIKFVGLDFGSPDGPPFEIHRTLISKEILIIENLTNLSALKDATSFEVFALPLKTATDSAPVRVVAVV